MSISDELQALVYQTLVTDAGVGALVGDRIYDGMPSGRGYPCITFGPSDTLEDDSEGIDGRIETLQLDCWSRDQGRLSPCKKICDAVKAALHKAELELSVNALILIRIDGMRVFRDADGTTAHGVVTVVADLEEL